MVEEMKEARRQAPQAIIMSVYLGAVTGFCFLVAICFCIGDIEATASSSTGVPLIQIFYDSTGSIGGACALTSLITVIVIVCANSLMAEGSRAVFAFARDRGLPFSSVFSRVESKSKVPVYAILLTTVVQIAFNSIYFGTLTGFETVITVATEGFCESDMSDMEQARLLILTDLSYAMPLLARLLSRITDPKNPAHKAGLSGPYNLGKWGLPLNLLGLVFLLFNSIIFNFPTINPVDSEDMNYTSAAVGVVMLISFITWMTTGRKHFTGPEAGNIGGAVQHVEGVEAAISGEHGHKEKKEHGL
jgi:amino acid transporter